MIDPATLREGMLFRIEPGIRSDVTLFMLVQRDIKRASNSDVTREGWVIKTWSQELLARSYRFVPDGSWWWNEAEKL